MNQDTNNMEQDKIYRWVKARENTPTDSDVKFIRYYDFKDCAYYLDGVWYNSNTDQPLPKPFVEMLEWLDENLSIKK